MTQLTQAPTLEHLTDLSAGWRQVCTILGVMRDWCGDLIDADQRRVYLRMVEHGQVITVQHRLGDGHYRVFAKTIAPKPERTFGGRR